jgi:hypothetical protein
VPLSHLRLYDTIEAEGPPTSAVEVKAVQDTVTLVSSVCASFHCRFVGTAGSVSTVATTAVLTFEIVLHPLVF